MEPMNLLYSIVQFSPFPERFEYINVGVVVFDTSRGKVDLRLAEDLSRVKKLFGEINTTFFKSALHDFAQRVSHHFSQLDASSMRIEEFNAKRMDLFRLTDLNAVAGQTVAVVVEKLFRELVTWHSQSKKTERINTMLTSAFKEAGVLALLDRRPAPVHIDQYGVNVQADYGYQNGVYNLIDAARFDTPQRGLAEAGKRILEGKALSETLDKRLIVVGDFGTQPDRFIENLRNDFEKAGAKLFRLEEVDLLSDEIRHAVR
ncbi:Protein of unknown function [Rhizobium sp. NFR07]|uniref:DUF3037 domain-containing protein n=1 Tax=Rhizobium sp. NFR07 TaxID=1566262 RepID=UPI0008EFB3E2|nr:DUF3037 domain-containing protein [Rhizobium sp. NFR07]SFB11178.1 Protein of unknown function [Rhizobium sp. NFR07]